MERKAFVSFGPLLFQEAEFKKGFIGISGMVKTCRYGPLSHAWYQQAGVL